MFFFSKTRKRKPQSTAAKTASKGVASTPVSKEPPSTPETVKGIESPGTAAPISVFHGPSAARPAEVPSENESKPANIQESNAPDEEQAKSPKKKHRTRISVTTANENEEDTDALNPTDEYPAIDTRASTGDFNDCEVSGDNSQIDLDRSVDNAADESAVDSTYLEDGEQNSETSQNDERNPEEDALNKNLLSTFEGCDIMPDSLKAILPKSWQQTDHGTRGNDATMLEEPVKKISCYSQEFATSFLEELLKKGFALVYHQPSLTIEEEKADWQGRSVTMNFKAGICNALEVFQPEIEWSTVGGGKDKKILTRSVSMLDIYSITVSSIDDMRDNLEAGESEEIQCFFTMTTKSGDIHVFEGMNIDESNRLVLGIKNISGRYSNLIVAGDPRVMVEFFDNSRDPQEIRLPFERAIVQVSHAFLGS